MIGRLSGLSRSMVQVLSNLRESDIRPLYRFYKPAYRCERANGKIACRQVYHHFNDAIDNCFMFGKTLAITLAIQILADVSVTLCRICTAGPAIPERIDEINHLCPILRRNCQNYAVCCRSAKTIPVSWSQNACAIRPCNTPVYRLRRHLFYGNVGLFRRCRHIRLSINVAPYERDSNGRFSLAGNYGWNGANVKTAMNMNGIRFALSHSLDGQRRTVSASSSRRRNSAVRRHAE